MKAQLYQRMGKPTQILVTSDGLDLTEEDCRRIERMPSPTLDWWGTRFIGWLCERMDMTNAMVEHAIRYPDMWIEAPFRPEMAEYCPKCGGKLLAMYGGGWDYDRKICGNIN